LPLFAPSSLLERLANHHGINQTAALEMAIRDLARRDRGDATGQPAIGEAPAMKKAARRKKT
jgi:hypothetical protein